LSQQLDAHTPVIYRSGKELDMPRFNANLSQLYTELDFLDRFEAAASDGFRGVEYRGPYDHAPAEIAELLRSNGLEQVLFNLPAGDWSAGERGIACLPGRQAEFREGLEQAIDYARALDCRRLNCLAGLMPEGSSWDELESTLVGNLRYACERLAGTGIALLIEALNRRDLPTCMLASTDNVERILSHDGLACLRLQYDFYHMQVMQGDVVRHFARLLPVIGHAQIAGNPGRHEPDVGELNYGFIFSEMDRLGYDGWVGCEYVPLGGTSEGLGWMRAWL
jgi:hydroxypyruvate isomerase